MRRRLNLVDDSSILYAAYRDAKSPWAREVLQHGELVTWLGAYSIMYRGHKCAGRIPAIAIRLTRPEVPGLKPERSVLMYVYLSPATMQLVAVEKANGTPPKDRYIGDRADHPSAWNGREPV